MNKKIKVPTKEQTELYDKITKIQTKIIDKVMSMKKQKFRSGCKHFTIQKDGSEQYNPKIDYYDKFWKVFLLNELSQARLQHSEHKMQYLNQKIDEVEGLFQLHMQLTGGKANKRHRKLAVEIQKEFKCPYSKCNRLYGKEVSLNLHIKLKHNGGNKTDREKAVKEVWKARLNGTPIPTFFINLPPGYIEEYGRNFSIKEEQPEQKQIIYEEQS